MENDEVVSRALANVQNHMQVKCSDSMQSMLKQSSNKASGLDEVSLPALLQQLGAEATQHGALVLPDKTGAGPMFVCLLHKLELHDA